MDYQGLAEIDERLAEARHRRDRATDLLVRSMIEIDKQTERISHLIDAKIEIVCDA